MAWWIWMLIAIYAIGFVGTYLINVTSLPVTGGLALLRAVAWPICLITGWPRGEPLRMD